jgi:hypothetical protein
MLQEPMHQTKDDKPQCQATTKKGTRMRFVIFLLLCAFEETTSFDRSRARLITQPPEFVSQRGFPREDTKTAFRFCARVLFSAACFLSRGILTDSLLSDVCLHICTTGDQCQRPATEGSKYCAQHTGGSK